MGLAHMHVLQRIIINRQFLMSHRHSEAGGICQMCGSLCTISRVVHPVARLQHRTLTQITHVGWHIRIAKTHDMHQNMSEQ